MAFRVSCIRLSTRRLLGSRLFAYTTYAYRPGICLGPENLSIQAPLILAFRVSYIRCRLGDCSDPDCLRIQYTLSTRGTLGSGLFAYTVYAYRLGDCSNPENLSIQAPLILAFRVSYIRCRPGARSGPDCLRIQYTLSTWSTLGFRLFAYTLYAYRPGDCLDSENLSIQAPLILAFRVSYIRCQAGAAVGHAIPALLQQLHDAYGNIFHESPPFAKRGTFTQKWPKIMSLRRRRNSPFYRKERALGSPFSINYTFSLAAYVVCRSSCALPCPGSPI